MIVAAGLLVLVGAGLFVAGLLTEVTALYWACVAACAVAAVLLYLARRAMVDGGRAAPAGTTPSTGERAPTADRAPAAPGASSGRHAGAQSAAAAAAESTATAVAGPPAVAPDPALPVTAPGGTASAPEEPVPAPAPAAPPSDAGEPPVEDVEVTDLLLVVDLRDEVLVVDEHPRYHVAGCRHLAGQETFPLPVDEARTDGFTPCGTCRPDATLAGRVRARK